jgi:hypothetical protein
MKRHPFATLSVGNEWFAVTPETVIEVARMIMGKPT